MAKRDKYKNTNVGFTNKPIKKQDTSVDTSSSSNAVSTVSKVGSRVGRLFTNPIKRSGSKGGNFNLFVFFVAILLLANFSRALLSDGAFVNNITFTGLLETMQEVPNVFDSNYSDLGLRIVQDWGPFWNTLRNNLNTMGMIIQTCWTFILLLYQLAVFMSYIVEGVFGLNFLNNLPIIT